MRVGPSALNPFTTHPVEIAGQVAALDAESGGRAFLGLAAGAWLDRLGLDTAPAADRDPGDVGDRGPLLAGDDVGLRR